MRTKTGLLGVVVLSTVAAWLLTPASALARSGGISNESGNPYSNNGTYCVACHSDSGPLPTVTLIGPQNLLVNEVGDYIARACGGPGVNGGFNANSINPNPNNIDSRTGLPVNEPIGTFIVTDPGTQILVAGNITHTGPRPFNAGTGCVEFNFQWQAPGFPLDMALYLAMNSEDGGGNTKGDIPNKTSLPINVSFGANLVPTANPGGPYSGVTGSPVNFNGSGSSDPDGTIVSYTWDFGDTTPEVTTGVATTSHTYFNAGTYTVTLQVTDNGGAISSMASTTANIVPALDSAPVANATAGEPYQANVFQNILFDGSLSTDDRGAILLYVWDYGDGTTGEGVTANKSYTAQGTYTVKLTVFDSAFQSGSTFTKATVLPPDLPPIANPGGPYLSEPGVAVNFDGSNSTDDRGIAGYLWDFDYLGAPGTATATGQKPTYTYSVGGEYRVYLEVTDTAGNVGSGFTRATIGVLPKPPNVVIAFPDFPSYPPTPPQVQINTPITMDGSGTTDDINALADLSFAWDVEYDPFTGTFTVDYTTPTISHTYTTGGSKDIRLEVTDLDGLTGVAEVSGLTVLSGVTPVLGKFKTFQNIGVSETKDTSRNLSIEASVIGGVPGQSYPGTYYVNSQFRDQRASTGDPKCTTGPTSLPISVSDIVTTYTVSFSYNICDVGSATLEGWVELGNGNAAPPQRKISAVGGDARPRANAGGPYTGVAGSPIALNGSATQDWNGAATVVSYAWNFGDGTTLSANPNIDATIIQPSHSYSAAGTYTVTLTVTDDVGLIGTHSTTATVSP